MALNDVGVFPTLPGLGWSVTKTPVAQTRIQRAVSGRELRAQDYPYPLYQFDLVFNFLRSGAYGELETLLGFVEACAGAYGTFLYDDPTDDTAVNQQMGVGDSSTTTFHLQYAKGIFVRPADAIKAVSAVYWNGIVVNPSSYSLPTGLNSNGLLSFLTPPPTGVSITADFTYYFRCRFVNDSYPFENFMYQLWQQKKLSFISVFP